VPKLYLVATPIGNLEDVSFRALRVLKEVGLIAAEDTRRTRHLLDHYDIKTSLTSYHDYTSPAKLDGLLKSLAEKDMALVSEAGMPGISDPGYDLVVAAIERGITVVPVPGPSVVMSALAISGLPTNQFTYLGFLPRQKGDRKRFLEAVAGETRTLVILEAPHRIQASLADIQATLGDRRLAVCRELTKIHEEVFRGTVSQATAHFKEPRGEFTLVVAGASGERKAADMGSVIEELRVLKEQGLTARDAVGQVAATSGLPKKEVYRAWLGLE